MRRILSPVPPAADAPRVLSAGLLRSTAARRAGAAALLALTSASAWALGSAPASTPTSTPAAGAASKAPAKPEPKPAAKLAAKPAPKSTPKPAASSAARRATTAAGAAAAAAATASVLPLALSPADEAQRMAASLAHVGEHLCEFKRTARLLAHGAEEGYLDLHFDNRVVTMKPVLSDTGALRLEDVRGQFLLLQIAFKSMILDLKTGRRVADECVHDKHREAKRLAAEGPPQPGLGIAPPPTQQ